jgi:DNA repair protein RadC
VTFSELSELLSHVTSDHEAKAKLICKKYKNIVSLSDASVAELASALDGDMKTTVYIKLVLSIVARVNCNKIGSITLGDGKAFSDYLVSLFVNRSLETVFLFSYDKNGKLIAADKVGEGTVNASTVIPRRLLEIAKLRSADTVSVAHNHPRGEAVASADDREALLFLEGLFIDAGIRFFGSYVVADNKCIKVEAI